VRPRDYVPLVLLAGIAGIFVVQGMKNQRDIPRPARRADRTHKTAAATTPATAPATRSPTTATLRTDTTATDATTTADLVRAPSQPARDFSAIQEQIKESAPGTYLLNMIAEQHDTVSHWPRRGIDAVRVWIDRHPDIPNFSASYPVIAERVFDEWHEAGFPLRFDFVTDSSEAELTIRWVSVLPLDDKSRIGITTRTHDEGGWITSANVLISTHDRDSGKPLDAPFIAGILRHEVGHALGLGHSTNRADVMYPESNTPVISRVDRATLHVLYLLPPGPVK
jgi:hypothetical protein